MLQSAQKNLLEEFKRQNAASPDVDEQNE